MPKFPALRMRRLRRTAALRRLVRETRVSVDDLVLPLFVVPGSGVRRPVSSMPGVAQTSVDEVVRDAVEAAELGIPAVLLFGVPESKDEVGSRAYAEDGVVQRAVAAIKEAVPELVVITDVCLCEYTSHGHCGVVRDGVVDNDATLELLARQALSHAAAGADVVAPSDMMDGRVGVLRSALDAEGFADVAILSYAAKFASAFYGPFREAVESQLTGDRKTYQQDGANVREALRELALDLEEGADVVMVKPAMAYLDVVRAVAEASDVPVAAYQVSGEYAMIEAAAANGWIERDRAILETLTGIRRAGADIVLTYWATEVATRL